MADPVSFHTLSSQYAKDDNQVWYRNKLLADADARTFEVDSATEGRDKNYSWRNGKRR
jgi:hypothetical protein